MSRPSAPAVGAGLIGVFVTLGVGVPIYFWAGMSSYFMNDLPGADDNLAYLQWGIISAILSSAVLVLLSVRNPRVTRRAVAFAVGTSAALNGAWLAFFFGTSIDELGDDSRTMYDAMSRSTVSSIATACAAAAILGLVVAVAAAPRRA
jgi:hypothetical protein